MHCSHSMIYNHHVNLGQNTEWQWCIFKWQRLLNWIIMFTIVHSLISIIHVPKWQIVWEQPSTFCAPIQFRWCAKRVVFSSLCIRSYHTKGPSQMGITVYRFLSMQASNAINFSSQTVYAVRISYNIHYEHIRFLVLVFASNIFIGNGQDRDDPNIHTDIMIYMIYKHVLCARIPLIMIIIISYIEYAAVYNHVQHTVNGQWKQVICFFLSFYINISAGRQFSSFFPSLFMLTWSVMW